MEWNEKLQMIIDYIEDHLQQKEEAIDQSEVANMAECSFDFFQKVFSYMNGIGLSEYIRQRKLTLAGYDLKSTNIRIVDLSYKYGYNSPTSFTKAFQQFHGTTPKAARLHHVSLRVTPKMQVCYRQEYAWNIVEKSAFRLIGNTKQFSCKDGMHYQAIPQFWVESHQNGAFERLASLDTGSPKGMFGFFGPFHRNSGMISYSIMIQNDQVYADEFDEVIIPEATWAVFDIRGKAPDAIQKGWKFLNEEWLIKYPFQHADCPEFEWYSETNSGSEHDLSQIWIPILKED